MEFYWERWETTKHHDLECPEKALLKVVESGLDKRHAKKLFLNLWAYWWSKSPEACILVTMTDNRLNGEGQQLRFWFEDRDNSSLGNGDHVDSSGHGLIVSIMGPVSHLRELVKKMLPMEEFEEEVVPPPSDAYKHHTAPSSITIWRRKTKHS